MRFDLSFTPRTGPFATALALLLLGGAAHASDPTTYDWKKEADQAHAEGGSAASPAGDVNGDGFNDVIVGARFYDSDGFVNAGRVWVHHGTANGLKQAHSWFYSPDEAEARAGNAAFTAGDVNGDGYSDVVVGIPGADAGGVDRGQIRVYYGSPTGIQDVGVTVIDGVADGDEFGGRVATAGDVDGDGYSDVIVGWDFPSANGKATVYRGSAAGLITTPAWSRSGAKQFGLAVGTAGDVNGDGYDDVIVGVPGKEVNGVANTGKVLVYHGSSAGLATTEAWSLEGAQGGARYGHSAATAGDVNGDGYSDVIVGAPLYGNNNGRVRIYPGGPTGISGQLWARTGTPDEGRFGHSVFTAGDFNADGYADVVIGATHLTDLNLKGGSAFVFFGGPTGPGPEADWTYDSPNQWFQVGHRIATAGDVNGDGFSDIVVGALEHFATELKEGAAYVFHGCASAPADTIGWSAAGTQDQEALGVSVSIAGDVDGDGFDDVIVGAPAHNGGQAKEGRALVYSGGKDGASSTPLWSAEGDQAQAQFGRSVSTAGDVNGDGYDDIIVGAPKSTSGSSGFAFVHVFHGSAGGPSATPDWEIVSAVGGSNLGSTVRSLGDVNGDGYGDVVVVDAWRLEVRVYHGSASGLSATPSLALDDTNLRRSKAAPAGDVNGDGFSDLIVYRRQFDAGADRGVVDLHLGSLSGIAAAPAWSSQGVDAKYGSGLAAAGDVNGDGFADLVVGSEDEDVGGLVVGRVSVFHGSPSGPSVTADWVVDGTQVGADFGEEVASAGDVNGDGYSDLLIGSPDFQGSFGAYAGQATLYLGSATGLGATAVWTQESQSLFGFLGESLSTAGDVDGDGFADILVGVPGFTTIGFEEGSAFLYYGNGGPGISRELRPRRTDDSAPLTWMGESNDDGVRVKGKVRSPFGRGKVGYEIEVKPLGTPFDFAGTTTTALFQTGAGFTKKVDGLAFGQAHRWRARPVYDLVDFPFQATGPWTSPARAAASEATFRTRTCSNGAAAASYGGGKPGTNGEPTLTSDAPVLGEPITLSIGNGLPGGAAYLFFGFSISTTPFDEGTLHVTPAGSVVLPLNGAGALDLPILLAENPAACGVTLYLQAMIPDPGATGFYQTAQTKGLAWTLGS